MCVALHRKDLGVDANYGKRQKTEVWKARCAKTTQTLLRVKGLKVSAKMKAKLVKAGYFSKLTCGSEHILRG